MFPLEEITAKAPPCAPVVAVEVVADEQQPVSPALSHGDGNHFCSASSQQ
jgi:hypothetical protein